MWYKTTAKAAFLLGKRNKTIKPNDTLYWTPSATEGKVIVFNGKHAWAALPEGLAAMYLESLDKIPAPDYREVADRYMVEAVR